MSGDRVAFRRLVRHTEVTIAAVSVRHAVADPEVRQRYGGGRGPPGVNAVKRWTAQHDRADVAGLADVYSSGVDGFYGTYSGIESVRGVVQRDGPDARAGRVR